MNQTSMKRHDRSSEPLAIQNHWYLVSIHGAVLFYIAVYPECTIRQIADEMALTQRTVWGLIGDLRREGMVKGRHRGRGHHDTIQRAAPLGPPRLSSPHNTPLSGPGVGPETPKPSDRNP